MQLSRLFSGSFKGVAAIASTGAALLSILAALHSWGIIGAPDVQPAVANMGAKWIGLKPELDTATALNDTLHLAATVTDKNGAILYGARPTWTTENPAVATVLQDGSVIARGDGATTIIAVIGELAARAHVIVHQTVGSVRIAGDSAITLAEGDVRALEARAFDPHGYAIRNRAAHWRVEDGAAAVSVDSTGRATASDVGRAVLSANVDGITAQTVVHVIPSPAAITMVKGDAQRAPAGAALSTKLIVRVVDRHGRPVEGTMVRFATPSSGGGVADPSVVATDADGRARTAWTLGDRPGQQHLFASVEHVDSTLAIVAEAIPQPANTRVLVVKDSVGGIVGKGVAANVAVRITDSTGHPLADVPVAWSADAGTIAAVAERTDTLGEARASWTLGPRAGVQRARARVASLDPVTVTALAAPGAAMRVSVERAGGAAAGAASASAPRAVSVVATVRDTFGNLVPRAPVKLNARSGSVSPAAVETDSTGRVLATWTLASKTGEQQLVAALASAKTTDTLSARASVTSTTRVRQAGRPQH